jgi:hypothetical protein
VVNAKNLKQQLEQLHDAIERADHVDEEGRRLLRDLETHIRELLDSGRWQRIHPETGMRVPSGEREEP